MLRIDLDVGIMHHCASDDRPTHCNRPGRARWEHQANRLKSFRGKVMRGNPVDKLPID
jgi:hypothetical protein